MGATNLQVANCWICGDEASSREHLVKRSDLQALVGSISQSDPIYLHMATRRNRRIGSLNADGLKFSKTLCAHCNSARTQPHDRAWDYFSAFIRSRRPAISAGDSIRSNSIFPYDTRRAMLHVHLYFVKLMGCKIVEGGIPINLVPFSQAIMNGRLHLNLYLSFGPKPGTDKVLAGGSNVETFTTKDAGVCAVAFWIHQVGDLWVNVIYATDGHLPPFARDAWHPRFGGQKMKMSAFTP
jgi:hypothetical protein